MQLFFSFLFFCFSLMENGVRLLHRSASKSVKADYCPLTVIFLESDLRSHPVCRRCG